MRHSMTEWHPALSDDLHSKGYAGSTIKKAAKDYCERKKDKTCWWWAQKGTPASTFREVEVPDSIPG